jgi:hypothetical protein
LHRGVEIIRHLRSIFDFASAHRHGSSGEEAAIKDIRITLLSPAVLIFSGNTNTTISEQSSEEIFPSRLQLSD